MIESDDHIDDLFREARENYPLKTGNGDWDRVFNELKKGTVESAISAPKTSRNFNKRLLWLLILIPIGLFMSVKYLNDKGSIKFNKIKQGENNLTKSKIPVHKGPLDNKIIVLQKSTNKVLTVSKDNPIGNNKLYESDNGQQHSQSTSRLSGPEGITNSNNKIVRSDSSNYNEQAKPDSISQFLSNMISHDLTKQTPNLVSLNMAKTPGLTSNSENPLYTKPSFSSTDTALTNNKKDSKKLTKISRGLYIGLLAGPDLSTIKLQKIKKAGYSLGILLGYQFNKRFSVETNLLWARKDYYTVGKYVDNKNFSIPSTISVINLDGYCQMYEFDLTGKYDFIPKRRQHFFARGGMASYFMKEQDYSYLASSSNGTQYSLSGDYGNATNNIFSVIHISAGYEYKMGKISIRMEPYLKIPVMGLGEGKLPFASISLYMGIIVPLH